MQQNQNNTVKYPLATAGKRILARVLDIAMISCLVLALGFAIFCTDPNFAWTSELVLAQKWRYGLFVSLMAIIFFSLMLLLPRLWNKTIGMRACKLCYFKKEECNNYALGMFKHELFIWEVIVFIALIIGWTLSFLSDHQVDSLLKGASAIFANELPDGVDKVCYYVGTGFSCLYGVAIIFLIAIAIATCVSNGKPAFHDKFSHVYMISTKPMVEKYRSVNDYKNQEEIRAPGAISDKSFEDIDSL